MQVTIVLYFIPFPMTFMTVVVGSPNMHSILVLFKSALILSISIIDIRGALEILKN